MQKKYLIGLNCIYHNRSAIIIIILCGINTSQSNHTFNYYTSGGSSSIIFDILSFTSLSIVRDGANIDIFSSSIVLIRAPNMGVFNNNWGRVPLWLVDYVCLNDCLNMTVPNKHS